MNQLN